MLKVMIVDDDKMVIDDLCSLIDWELNGFSIVSIQNNGARAMEDISKCNPDIVLADVVMPIMNGIELLRNIKTLSKETVVVLLSSYSEFSYAKEAIKLGVYDYILKDEISEESLLSLLNRISEYINDVNVISTTIAEQKITDLFKYSEQNMHSLEHEENFKHPKYYFICEKDVTFPYLDMILSRENSEKQMGKEEMAFLKKIQNLDFYVSNMGLLADNRIVIELESRKKYYSIQKNISLLCAFARLIQQKFESEFGDSLSIFFIKEKMTARNAAEYYRKKEKNILNKYFVGSNLIIELGNSRLECRKNIDVIDLTKYNLAISNYDENNVILEIENALLEIKEKRDVKSLIQLIDNILHDIKDCCGEKFLYDITASEPIDECLDMKAIQCWIVKIVKMAFEQKRLSQKYSTEVRKALAYINLNYHKDELSVQEVAEHVGLSYSHMSFVFKKEVGQTIGECMLEVRIEKAKKLLKTGTYKVYEVAELVGVSNSQYFSQIFSKIVGCKPKDYSREGQYDVKKK